MTEDEFLTSVAAIWPEHTLRYYGEIHPRGDGLHPRPIYTCYECNAIYWPEDDGVDIYTDRYVAAYDNGTPNSNHCECWEILRVIPRIEEPIKGLQRIRDDLEGS